MADSNISPTGRSRKTRLEAAYHFIRCYGRTGGDLLKVAEPITPEEARKAADEFFAKYKIDYAAFEMRIAQAMEDSHE